MWIGFWYAELVNIKRQGGVVVKTPIRGLDEEKYRGQWLVINGKTGKIVVAGSQLAKVQAKAKTIERPVYYKVPTSDTHHVVIT